ncbi:hypothetical protein GR157_04130 [Burkholderia sp. 4701]|nr:hypothetical protein [Burkholderia sp. 4701]MXN81039.1 hypothetical protein [Burkholderia sp. 4812]
MIFVNGYLTCERDWQDSVAIMKRDYRILMMDNQAASASRVPVMNVAAEPSTIRRIINR